MLYSSAIFARNASSILSHLSRLPTELSAHPPLFTLSTNTPTASLTPLVTALSSLYFSKQRRLPLHPRTPAHLSHPETQVGRWHAMQKRGDWENALGGGELVLSEEESVDWENVWSRSVAGDAFPASLRELRQVDVHTIVTLMDNAPQGLNQAFSSLFIHATQASSRLRLPSRQGGHIPSSSTALSNPPVPLVSLSPESPPVTQSEGNLINELDNANPTALPVSAIEKSALSGHAAKDDEFYWVGLSHGTMALDTETAPGVGTGVQFFHHPVSHDVAPRESGLRLENTLTFVASSQVSNDTATPLEECHDDDVTALEDSFVAASENGFLLRRGEEAAWTSIAPGAQVCLTW
ncbi:hypothetical protein V8E53_013574 [Lactarius tabidus]